MSDRDRAEAMIRIAAALEGVEPMHADPMLQIARIGFDEENDSSVRLQAHKTLVSYIYRQQAPETARESGMGRLEDGGGITIGWATTVEEVPVLEHREEEDGE